MPPLMEGQEIEPLVHIHLAEILHGHTHAIEGAFAMIECSKVGQAFLVLGMKALVSFCEGSACWFHVLWSDPGEGVEVPDGGEAI